MPGSILGLLADDERGRAVPGAVRFAGGMTLGFVAVFGLVGVVLAPLLGALTRYLPVVAVVLVVAARRSRRAGTGPRS